MAPIRVFLPKQRRVLAAVLGHIISRRNTGRRRKKRSYVREINLQRPTSGEFHCLVQEMRADDQQRFYENFRMSPARFDHLLGLLNERLLRFPTHKIPVTPGERLCVTLKILAQGLSMRGAAATFRLGTATVNQIFNETCVILWQVLSPEYVHFPSTPDEWQTVADGFGKAWNFPNCIGAMDGKHMAIKKPPESGSEFYNYKKFTSLVLLAVVDAEYKFTYVDIGSPGRAGDAAIYRDSSLKAKLDTQQLNLPPNRPLPDTNAPAMPYVFVGDEAFPLSNNLMRPYSKQSGLNHDKRVFNYRLSRARRISEDAFGILVQRFRIFHKPIEGTVTHIRNIVKAAIALHNYLKSTDASNPASGSTAPPDVDRAPQHLAAFQVPLGRQGANRAARAVEQVRDTFKAYFCSSTGAVDWQDASVEKGNY